jgi:hypothetical protein
MTAKKDKVSVAINELIQRLAGIVDGLSAAEAWEFYLRVRNTADAWATRGFWVVWAGLDGWSQGGGI